MGSVSSLNSLLSSSSGSSTDDGIDVSSLLAAATGASSTGIDVTSAVDAAIYAERAPERQWQAEQSTLQSQISAIGTLQSSLSTVSTDLNSLSAPTGALAARAVSSNNSSLVTATATAGTATGTHLVTVGNLATAAAWYSSPLASGSGSVGTSTLTITQNNGTATSFALGTSGLQSLNDVVAAINGDALGITASVVTDATGSRLALESSASGAAGNFTVSEGPGTGATWNSASLASAASTLQASSFQVDDGSTDATINVSAGSTLADVANAINSAGLNVSASVVSDSSGQHLAVASTIGGSVTVSADPAVALTQSSSGTDAKLEVDGIPVTSSSNTVTGALPGITLNLQGAAPNSQVSLTVSADATQVVSAVSQFLTDYNSTLQSVSSQFTFSTTSGTQGALAQDSTVRSLQSALLSIGGYTSPSVSGASSGAMTLADLGITMQNDGTLTLNTATLENAVSSNAAQVQSFFQGASGGGGFAANAVAQITPFYGVAGGALQSDSNNLTQQYNNLQTNVSNYESGYIASQQTILTSMYSKAEIALQQLPTLMKQIQSELGQNSGS